MMYGLKKEMNTPVALSIAQKGNSAPSSDLNKSETNKISSPKSVSDVTQLLSAGVLNQ